MQTKNVVFSEHALVRLATRGTTQEEVIRTIHEGEQIQVKKNRIAFRKNFAFRSKWKGKHYEIKQVMPVVVEEQEEYVVVTVFTFYFGGEE